MTDYPTSRQEEESGHLQSRGPLGHYLPRSPGPTFLFSLFCEVTPVAAAFSELSWVPLIHAWMGPPGRQCGQTPSDVAAGLLDLGTSGLPVSSLGAVGLRSLSCKSGPLARMESWVPASGVQSSIRDLGAPSSRAVLIKAEFQNSVSLLRHLGQAPPGVWRLHFGVRSLRTVTSQGSGHTA